MKPVGADDHFESIEAEISPYICWCSGEVTALTARWRQTCGYGTSVIDSIRNVTVGLTSALVLTSSIGWIGPSVTVYNHNTEVVPDRQRNWRDGYPLSDTTM